VQRRLSVRHDFEQGDNRSGHRFLLPRFAMGYGPASLLIFSEIKSISMRPPWQCAGSRRHRQRRIRSVEMSCGHCGGWRGSRVLRGPPTESRFAIRIKGSFATQSPRKRTQVGHRSMSGKGPVSDIAVTVRLPRRRAQASPVDIVTAGAAAVSRLIESLNLDACES
jgi:hypothetical protein